MSIEQQMHIIGIVMGWIIAAGYLWSALNFVVKRIYRNRIAGLPAESTRRKRFTSFMRSVVGSHTFVPLFLLTIMLLHLLMELIHVGFFITGVIAIGLMTLQIGLGIFGATVKKKRMGTWLKIHRFVAALLLVSISVHVVTVVLIKP